MSGLIIGLLTGLATIVLVRLLRFLDEHLIYGLVLCAIGFLYVGFTWTDSITAVASAVQALIFLLIAYFGTKHSLLLLAAGYFLHGAWDLVFGLWAFSKLLPPHYNLFCLAVDFAIGFYLLILNYGRISYL
ncbi:DUF6010 family protein [Mucilaginibacter sp. UR6-11]|uniref:DUF6010 family protein n=1 Tax=Mucilaginibacter sp. UR6-11 TaxID=1435644 RepID=UPI001E2F177D|nr:DUF6010 family protein [Mucilaginibacter sp. UR6-11]MCC8423506.1 hypothetical protein [Mucilaginibacter sp. UR6-11]